MRGASMGIALALLATACAGPEPVKVAGAGEATVGAVVVCSDYVSSQVALMGTDGVGIVAGSLLHSGAVAPGVHLALSGDVVLPSTAPSGHEALLIDRTYGVLTWIDMATGEVRDQWPVAEGFAGNPHDALVTETGEVLVTRYGVSGDGGEGDDVLVLGEDGEALGHVGFDLTGWLARPDRVARVGGQVLVTLNHASPDFTDWGPGRYARLGREGDEWHVEKAWEISGASNCGALQGGPTGGALICTGAYQDGAADRLSSSVHWLDAAGEVQASLQAADERVGGALAPAVAWDGDRVWLVRFGTLDGQGDEVLEWRPASDEVASLVEVERAFVIEDLAALSGQGLLVPIGVPEAPRLCRYDGAEERCVQVCSESGLPPRSILGLEMAADR